MTKRAKQRKPKSEPQPQADDELPFGYLETADPPRKNLALVAVAAVALGLWMAGLVYLAFWSN